MAENEKEAIERDDILDFEDEVTTQMTGTEALSPENTSITEDAPLSEEPLSLSDTPFAEEAVSTPLSDEETSALPGTDSSPAKETSAPVPEYGAPQPLFEDIIPLGLVAEKKKEASNQKSPKETAAAAKKAEKEAAAAAKKAEKEAAAAAKKAEKEKKKKAKTEALIAAVEAEAVEKAKAEMKRDTGETYELPESPAEPPAAPVIPVVAPVKEESSPKKEKGAFSEPEHDEGEVLPPVKEYTDYERKLRRKYKLGKDVLLSANDVVPGFVIAKGENVIRTYRCLTTKKGDGTLCLTNRRLLINAGERSELDIAKVSGIKFSQYTNFSFPKFLFWIIFLGLGVFMLLLPTTHTGMNIPFLTGESWKGWFTYLFYACGGVSAAISIPLFFTMVKKTFYFYVYAKEEAPFFEVKSKAYAKREKKGKVYKYMVTKAGRESEKAARELGALIIEAKEGRYDF